MSAAGIGLLLAAAGTFLSTRWETMTIDAKLVVLVTLTLLTAAGARWAAERLPSTAEALVHLAWGLVVVDVAASAVRSGATTSTATALAGGSAIIGALGLLQRRSVLAPLVMVGAAPTTSVATAVAVDAEAALVGWIGIGLATVVWLGIEAALSARGATSTTSRLAAGTGGAAVLGLLGGSWLLGFGAPPELLEDPSPVSAVAVVVGGLVLAGSSLRRSSTLGAVTGCGLAVVGQWWWAVLVGVEAVDAWLAPTAIAVLAWMTLRLRRDPERRLDTTDRTTWLLASIGAVAGSVLERSDGGPVGHVIAGVAIAVGLVVLGGSLRLGAPLLIGIATLATFPIIELVLGEVTIATWMWMGLAGLMLAGIGAVLEFLDTSPTTAGRELHRRYRTTFR